MLNRERRKVRESRDPRLARNGVSLSSFRISGGPEVRRVLTNHVDENISIGLPSLGNSEASAGLSVLTPFRSSLDNKPCIGRKGNQSRNRRDFPGAKVWPVVPGLSRASTSLLIEKALFDATVSGCERFIETCGYLGLCHNYTPHLRVRTSRRPLTSPSDPHDTNTPHRLILKK